MNKTSYRLLGLLTVFGLVACQPEVTETNTTTTGTAPVDEQTILDQPSSITLDITAEGREFYFNGEEEANPTLVIPQGSMVEATLCVTGGSHDWVVDELNVATAQVSENDECSTVQFMADQVGEFEYYCSVGNHREQGMVGSIVVN